MKIGTIIQAAILMLMVALAASCTVGKEYTTRVFGKPQKPVQDSSTMAVRFLELEDLNDDQDKIAVVLSSDTTIALPPETQTPPKARKDVVRTKKTRD